MDIGETFFAFSADCKRKFSLMNGKKGKIKNRFGECHLDMLTRVKSHQSYGNSINSDSVNQE